MIVADLLSGDRPGNDQGLACGSMTPLPDVSGLDTASIQMNPPMYLVGSRRSGQSVTSTGQGSDPHTLYRRRDWAVLRLLTLLSRSSGSKSFRYIAAAAGMPKSTVESAVNKAEESGLIAVVHGSSYFDPDETRTNEYEVTPAGVAHIPVVLREATLSGDLALDLGVWSEGAGYGLRGLLLLLTFPPETRFTAKDAAAVLQTSPRSAANILNRWEEKRGGLVFRLPGNRFFFAPGPAHEWATAEMEANAEKRSRYRNIEAEMYAYHRPRWHMKVMIDVRPELIRWVTDHVPANSISP